MSSKMFNWSTTKSKGDFCVTFWKSRLYFLDQNYPDNATQSLLVSKKLKSVLIFFLSDPSIQDAKVFCLDVDDM